MNSWSKNKKEQNEDCFARKQERNSEIHTTETIEREGTTEPPYREGADTIEESELGGRKIQGIENWIGKLESSIVQEFSYIQKLTN